MVVADLCDAFHDMYSQLDHSDMQVFGNKDEGDYILYTRENTWVAKEMWEHFAQRGIFPNSTVLKRIKADLLEVYCSTDIAS